MFPVGLKKKQNCASVKLGVYMSTVMWRGSALRGVCGSPNSLTPLGRKAPLLFANIIKCHLLKNQMLANGSI